MHFLCRFVALDIFDNGEWWISINDGVDFFFSSHSLSLSLTLLFASDRYKIDKMHHIKQSFQMNMHVSSLQEHRTYHSPFAL